MSFIFHSLGFSRFLSPLQVVEGHSAPSVGGDQNANRGPDVFGTKGNQTQTSREAVGPGMYDVVFRHHALLFLTMLLFF